MGSILWSSRTLGMLARNVLQCIICKPPSSSHHSIIFAALKPASWNVRHSSQDCFSLVSPVGVDHIPEYSRFSVSQQSLILSLGEYFLLQTTRRQWEINIFSKSRLVKKWRKTIWRCRCEIAGDQNFNRLFEQNCTRITHVTVKN